MVAILSCSCNFQSHQTYAGKTLQCVGLLPMMIFSFVFPVSDDLGVWPGLHYTDQNLTEMRIEEHQQYSHLSPTSQQWQSWFQDGASACIQFSLPVCVYVNHDAVRSISARQ